MVQPTEAIYAKSRAIGPLGMLVFYALCFLANAEGEVLASSADLARGTSVLTPTEKRLAVKRLVDAGVLAVEPELDDSTYRLDARYYQPLTQPYDGPPPWEVLLIDRI